MTTLFKMPAPEVYALKWPYDSRLNHSAVFDTKLDALEYLSRCDSKITVHPLYTTEAMCIMLGNAAQLCDRNAQSTSAEEIRAMIKELNDQNNS